MRTGGSYRSVSENAVFAGIVGAWDARYTAANLSDTTLTTKVARATGANVSFTAVLAADSTVQIVALTNHNIAVGQIRVRLYSDAAMTTLVADSGTSDVWTVTPQEIPTATASNKHWFQGLRYPGLGSANPGARLYWVRGLPMAPLAETIIVSTVTAKVYAWTRPVIFAQPYTVRAIRVDLTDMVGTTEIGACEIAQWWEWPHLNTGDVGFKPSGSEIGLVGGGSLGPEGFKPRVYNGEVQYMDTADSLTTGLDFQKLQGLSRPFIFVEDADDPATWERTCFLARNTDLPPFVGVLFDRDTFQFRLLEHAR